MENKKFNNMDKAELIGQIIDVFQDFLEEKEISKNEFIIYGSNYDDLADSIESTLRNWNLIE